MDLHGQKPPTPPDSPDDANGYRRTRQQPVWRGDMVATLLPLSPDSSSGRDLCGAKALLSPYSGLRRSAANQAGGLGLSRLDMPQDLVTFADDYTEDEAAHSSGSPLTSIYTASSSASPCFNGDFSPATCSPAPSISSSRRPSAPWERETCDSQTALTGTSTLLHYQQNYPQTPDDQYRWPRAISSAARRISAAVDVRLSSVLPQDIDSTYAVAHYTRFTNFASKKRWLFPRLLSQTIDLRRRQLSQSHLQPAFSLGAVEKGKSKAHYQDSAVSAFNHLLQNVRHSLRNLSRRPKRSRTRVKRLLFIFTGLALAYWLLSRCLHSAYRNRSRHFDHPHARSQNLNGRASLSGHNTHPIANLMSRARRDWQAKVARQSKTVGEAIAEYKKRYKRHPPEGFEEWFHFAQESGTVMPDEYDSMMAALEPFWAMDAHEMRRRTIQIGMQPSFAVVHVETGKNGETYWDANEDQDLVEPFGLERARGFERMIQPFVDRPGIRNMAFAINELAEPRVLVPWEEQQLIREALRNNTEITKEQYAALSGGGQLFFPAPIWQGDGTTWETFKRTCPPNSVVRRELVTMTNTVIHEADVDHLMYVSNRTFVTSDFQRKKRNIVSDTLLGHGGVRVQVNPPRPPKRRVLLKTSGPDLSHHGAVGNGVLDSARKTAAISSRSVAPRTDVMLNTPSFAFNDNLTSVSHAQICEDSRIHETQGQFCSDFRSVAGLYPIFSPSSMAGFSDIIIPSHYYASESPKYHLDVHINRVKRAVKDPQTGKWTHVLAIQDFPKWEDRISKIFWRGSTTGGGNNPAGRQLMYQRHRFVQLASANNSMPIDVIIPGANATDPLTHVQMSHKVANVDAMDVAFTSLDGCGHEKVCQAVRKGQYNIGERVPLIDVIKYKMLADIDGMAYSARFMALFESKAAVLKSTIYNEYWSDQIQPWYHYIPLSLMYDEIYNIYAYFLGPPSQKTQLKGKDRFMRRTESVQRIFGNLLGNPLTNYEPHERLTAEANRGTNDEALRRIANQGYEWQQAFGRKRSMEVYCYRLALEWSRLWTRDGSDGFTQQWYPPQKNTV